MNAEYLDHVISVKESLQIWFANLEQYHKGITLFTDEIDLSKEEMVFGKWYYGEGQVFESFETFKNLEAFYDEMYDLFFEYKTIVESPIKKGFFSNNISKRQNKLDNLIIEIRKSARRLIKSVEIFENNLKTSPLFENYVATSVETTQTTQTIETSETADFETFEDLLEAVDVEDSSMQINDEDDKLDAFLKTFEDNSSDEIEDKIITADIDVEDSKDEENTSIDEKLAAFMNSIESKDDSAIELQNEEIIEQSATFDANEDDTTEKDNFFIKDEIEDDFSDFEEEENIEQNIVFDNNKTEEPKISIEDNTVSEDYDETLQREIERVKLQLKKEYEEKLKQIINKEKENNTSSKEETSLKKDNPDIDIDEEIRRILS